MLYTEVHFSPMLVEKIPTALQLAHIERIVISNQEFSSKTHSDHVVFSFTVEPTLVAHDVYARGRAWIEETGNVSLSKQRFPLCPNLIKLLYTLLVS
ncbi:MAG: hypothetical protein BMS9Abin37_1609 [Acidobacteriota bacterium]|nr:MAG: hypothetical protein BMS9Abin37_1609 [Acidobacteriota bacterium]